ncbi:hypothetical protein [Dyella sp.]|uniref:hypothetical protein n=1 Tax=Dyella sp. TaxID=1869338 RepID=UPI002ED3F193
MFAHASSAFSRILGTLMLLGSFSGSAMARDLDHNDPDRAAILDAARQGEAVKFVVKDLVRYGDTAYLCALKNDGDGIEGTDDALDVYTWGFYKGSQGWHAISLSGRFASSPDQVDCRIDQTPADSADVVRKAMAESVAGTLRDSLEQSPLSADQLAQLTELRQAHILGDVDVEGDKIAYDKMQLDIVLEHCKDDACRQANQHAFQKLGQWQTDTKVSSLAWNRCRYGLRIGSLVADQQCLEAAMPLPVCRPHQKLPQDQATISSCLVGIRQRCEHQFANTADRDMACP